MWRSAGIAALAAVVLAGCSWHGNAGSSTPAMAAPFVASGGNSGGPGSGLWGDTVSGPSGNHLGCIPGRRYTLVVGLRNRSPKPVTVTSVAGPQAAPAIIHRVQTLIELAPRAQQGDGTVGYPSDWTSPPLQVPPGKSALVQTTFLMGRCDKLRRHRRLVANRVITVAYRDGTSAGHQDVPQRAARIVLTRGPTERTCATPSGASRLQAFDVSCSTAEQAAVTCRHLQHGTWGQCSAATRDWDCTYTSSSRKAERCWLATKRQSVKVRWL
jgi:hypothetical protein